MSDLSLREIYNADESPSSEGLTSHFVSASSVFVALAPVFVTRGIFVCATLLSQCFHMTAPCSGHLPSTHVFAIQSRIF